MLIQQNNILLEETSDEISDLAAEDNRSVNGGVMRFLVGLVFIIYTIIAFTTDLSMGFYGYKIMIMVSTGLLLFNPTSYPYLLGLLVPMYYPLKSGQHAMPGYNYMVQFSSVMIILMAIFQWIWEHLGEYRRNLYKRFDLASFCLLGIGIFTLFGGIVSENKFLYVHRMVDILAFGCVFYLGRSCLNVPQSLRLLLIGLTLGIVAFIFPVSVGFVLRRGLYVLGHLHEIREEMGLGFSMVGAESGTLLVALALAYSLSGSGMSLKLRQIALWLVAVPSAIVILLYLSRGAILLLPVTVFLTLVFSGQRRNAILVALVSMIVGIVVCIKMPDLVYGFTERMATFFTAASLRGSIRTQAILYGLSHPLLGMGAGQFPLIYVMADTHNEPLNMLAEHGVIAFLLYILFWMYLGHMAFKLRLSADVLMRSMGGVFLVLLLIYFAFTQVQPLYYYGGGILFNFSVGMLSTLYYRLKSENRIYELESQ